MKKKLLLLLGGAAVLIAVGLCIFLLQPEPAGITLYDSQGELLAQAQSRAQLRDCEYWAYADIAVTEAVTHLAVRESLPLEKAEKQLFQKGYAIYTDFDKALYEKMKTALSQYEHDTGCAITDLYGVLLAVYSSGQSNLAATATAPYSAFKPLSVYTPAIESGKLQWTTRYTDAPYKQMTTASGESRGWPANASGTYSNKKVDISQAIRQSLNTVAVRCLVESGVKSSMEFLKDQLGVPMAAEEYVEQQFGEEEILGSIALGYLERGVTPVDMAGYYQIFATGGKYTKPTAIARLVSSDGTLIHKRQNLEKQVVSPVTAELMNKLLQGVVSEGGTGRQAHCGDVPVAGKTGTGDDNAGNWFVGVTPGYSCAVWHGAAQTNEADAMFASVIRSVYADQPDALREFITYANLYPIVYCADSGKSINQGCTSIEMGYFQSQDALPVCDQHKQGG